MEKKGKLELTWVGKYEEEKLEPRILIEDKSKSYGDPNTENMLIHGDNLLALKALENKYTGMIKCIYIDPPYNTGNAFALYDDGLEHSVWLNMMRDRLIILKNLLAEEGSIWIQIDDEEQAYLKILSDEIFGRTNFVNMISVNMKNIAGASGGGEDKRIKKNCEYILIYAKDYYRLEMFKGAYEYEEIGSLVERYREEGISWKYSSALINSGQKEYIGSTVDGSGDEIKIYKRSNFVIKSVNQLMRDEGISEKDAYNKYAKCFFQTQMPQSSIRPRIMQKVNELGRDSELYSIEYIPKTGRNKGQIKEGNVEFPNGKKPEALIQRIFEMTTNRNEIILDSFLGSGTSIAVANKMNRKWIGIERGEQAYTHCKVRLDSVIDGEQGGISKDVGWKGGGGYRFYELAEPLLVKNKVLPVYQINPSYTWDMVCEAICKIEGFTYEPSGEFQGHSSENRFIHITEEFVNTKYVMSIMKNLGDKQSLLIYCKKNQAGMMLPDNVEVKKIPRDLLDKCNFESEVQE